MAVRVLIANRSRITRDIIRNHLECGGCQVVAETVTVAQTIDLFRMTRPDVITLDLGLRGVPGVDALSLFRTIRRESPATSIVVVGAPESSDSQRIYRRKGALECIAEPFDTSGLIRMWRRLSDTYPELKRGNEAASGRRIRLKPADRLLN
ncbi:MAG TPA: response regulator [Candidatus Binataceae bacterium]|nr:response regulator [Candidatus Binataceae bacterium]